MRTHIVTDRRRPPECLGQSAEFERRSPGCRGCRTHMFRCELGPSVEGRFTLTGCLQCRRSIRRDAVAQEWAPIGVTVAVFFGCGILTERILEVAPRARALVGRFAKEES